MAHATPSSQSSTLNAQLLQNPTDRKMKIGSKRVVKGSDFSQKRESDRQQNENQEIVGFGPEARAATSPNGRKTLHYSAGPNISASCILVFISNYSNSLIRPNPSKTDRS